MKKKNLIKTVAGCAMACSMFVAGCADTDNNLTQSWSINSAYVQAQAEGFTGTFEEFLSHLTNIGDVDINNEGHLIITLGDGTKVDAGKVTGEDGRDGEDGQDGRDGVDGEDGEDGQDGRDGVDGEDGEDGQDGRDGVDGKDGEDGQDGRDGVDGKDGVDGQDGRDGVDGKDGKDGVNGQDGKDGVDGKDGEDGKEGRVGFVVTSETELAVAVTVPNSYIILASDITTTKEISVNTTKDFDFILDLNGFTITNDSEESTSVIGFRTLVNSVQTDYTINAVIKNGTFKATNTADVTYGIMTNGNNINLTLENVDAYGVYGGLYTNGNGQSGSLTAVGCHFESTIENFEDGCGAYLAGNYVYNFTDSLFIGNDGIATKSGTHTYTDCQIAGIGTHYEISYNGNGSNNTGAGLAIISCEGYSSNPYMNVTINNSIITSINGYGIVEGVTSNLTDNFAGYLQSLNIDENTTINGGLASIKRNGEVYYVKNADQLYACMNINNATVVLENDITIDYELNINATQDMTVTIDLNGHKITNETTSEISAIMAFRTIINKVQTDNVINVTIQNGELFNNAGSLVYYGILTYGNNVNITLDNITSCGNYAGIYTNGMGTEGGSITGTNCHFYSTAQSSTDGAGAYFAANYTYSFTNTIFEGCDGVSIKSGKHTYTNCTLTGNGDQYEVSYNGNGADNTGAGITIVSCEGYTPYLDVTITGCTITSAKGYGIVEGAVAKDDTQAVSYLQSLVINDNTITGALGQTSIQTQFDAQ